MYTYIYSIHIRTGTSNMPILFDNSFKLLTSIFDLPSGISWKLSDDHDWKHGDAKESKLSQALVTAHEVGMQRRW